MYTKSFSKKNCVPTVEDIFHLSKDVQPLSSLIKMFNPLSEILIPLDINPLLNKNHLPPGYPISSIVGVKFVFLESPFSLLHFLHINRLMQFYLQDDYDVPTEDAYKVIFFIYSFVPNLSIY